MSLPHPLSPEERAQFDEQVERLTGSITYEAMPPIRFAEYPEDFWLWADLSDKKQFNERYIDSYYMMSRVAFGLNFALFFHNMCLIGIIYFIVDGGPFIGAAFGYLVAFFPFLSVFLDLQFRGIGRFLFRFNRQTQMVHRANGGRRTGWFSTGPLSVAWRDAVPVIKRGSDPFYIFPNYGIDTYLNDINPWNHKPIFIFAAFDLDRGPERFEFIRRYMESGLKAITPPPDMEKDKLYDLSAFPARFHRGWFYHCGFGPWVDRWLKKKIDEYRWPEEIERLCAPGADLSGIDTTPVKSIDTCFYRFKNYTTTYVKPDGTPY